ncbi:ras and Rab interactor 2-like isoform X2 [Falco biarmicus]|uniref:ras and Rab interactor 2-like isoform X2 n=1 Tax=Falco biarmicus TaxID=345155 RepID=UPI0024BCCF12|nr:ras and Rab interactor 2-like isoform X2 [Falco biarmicus]
MGASAAERRRRRRGDLLRGQLGALAALALLLAGCAAGRGGYDALNYSVESNDKWSGRQLLQANEENATDVPEDGGQPYVRNCTEPALHEFPNDIFTNEDRRHGAVVLHVLCAVYMFYALAIVCDDFFVPSLEKICERLHLSEDVAGATFMAAGSSAPELFTSVIGVFITKGDVGVGTIVGSAVFNILCIIGVCGLFAGQVVALSSWSLLRDSIYYTLSVVALIVFIYDEKVSWWESLVLVLMYIIYIVIMKYNSTIHHCFERKTKNSANMVNGLANNTEMDDNSSCDATVVLLKKGNFHRKASVIMVDELLSAYPHQLSFSEAGLRIMITSHFPPKTRLSMASRMLINERQRLINSRTYTNGESEVAIKIPIKHVVENGTGPSNSAERGVNGTRRDEDMAEAGNETENENEDNENNENDEEEEDDDDDDDHEGPYTPFDLPTGKIEILKWLFTWPLSFVLYFTVPNCNKPHLEKWFMVTFASSTLWIAAFSYMMVWMVTIIGYTLGIPDVIMGITFLAAGTSVPDCMASLIVARQGMGDMAVSNSIGSNVFDILIGLGLPWALQTLAVNYGSYEFKAHSGVFPGKMSSLTMKAHCLDKRGSFFKLIDTIASEIGELKQEMVQTDLTVEEKSADLRSLVKDMDNVSPEKNDVKSCVRDSGYDSLSNKLSILDKLLHTHPVWLQLGLNDTEAMEILQAQPPGIFLVRKSARLQKKVLSLCLPSECGSCLKEFAIKESTYTFSLEGSGISFADLFRLVAFYCISRDVLPFTLKLPHAIAATKTEAELEEIAQLGLNFWSSPANSNTLDPSTPRRPVPLDGACKDSRQLCLINGVHSIRTRTPSELECSQTNGALCFINPLFLKVHSQDVSGSLKRQSLKTQDVNGTARPRSPPPRPPPPSINSILMSPQLSRTIKQASMPETVNHKKERGLDLLQNKPTPIPPPRLKKQAVCTEVEGSSKTVAGIRPGRSSVCVPEAAGLPGETLPEPASAAAKKTVATSSESHIPWNGGRQRLSDMSISTSSSDSLDFDRSMPLFGYEGDTNSSLEDFEGESDQESMAPPLKPKKKRNSSFVLPKIVKSQLQKVSGVFSSFMTPEKRMIKKIAEMSQDKRTYFGCLVQDYVSFLQENKECHVSSTDMLQTIRQFMTQVKNYLSQSSELDPPIESLIPEDQIDVVLEKAMHKCILKPLKSHIEAMLKEFHTADGSWKQLKENLQLVRQRNPQELGVFVPTPDFVDVEKIKVKFVTMQKMYSPEKKVTLLLRVCKLIYTVMENNSGRLYGADDFLPVLTYVLAQCDMLELDTEIEYMMELLDPSLLHGEGGYYLTSAYGALSLIKNFQEEQAAQLLSSEARDTLRQWHKRRTTNRTIPSVDDFQQLNFSQANCRAGCHAGCWKMQGSTGRAGTRCVQGCSFCCLFQREPQTSKIAPLPGYAWHKFKYFAAFPECQFSISFLHICSPETKRLPYNKRVTASAQLIFPTLNQDVIAARLRCCLTALAPAFGSWKGLHPPSLKRMEKQKIPYFDDDEIQLSDTA